jgi:hypothetical protein
LSKLGKHWMGFPLVVEAVGAIRPVQNQHAHRA